MVSPEDEPIFIHGSVSLLLPSRLNFTSSNKDCLGNSSESTNNLFSLLRLNETDESVRMIKELSLNNVIQLFTFFHLIETRLEETSFSCPSTFKLNVLLNRTGDDTFTITIGKSSNLNKEFLSIENSLVTNALDSFSGNDIIRMEEVNSVIIAISHAEMEILLNHLKSGNNSINAVAKRISRRKRSSVKDVVEWILKFVRESPMMTAAVPSNFLTDKEDNDGKSTCDMLSGYERARCLNRLH